jgi:hypothetical protein
VRLRRQRIAAGQHLADVGGALGERHFAAPQPADLAFGPVRGERGVHPVQPLDDRAHRGGVHTRRAYVDREHRAHALLDVPPAHLSPAWSIALCSDWMYPSLV